MANYHDIFQKGQDDIVPLAMQAMKLKMDQEQFEMVKTQALKKIETENALKERMSKIFAPKTEEVTLPEVQAPVVPSNFGGNVPQFGLPEMKVPRTVQPQPAPMEVLMATADLMKPEDFLKSYTEIKGKPTVHSLAPGNILVDSVGNKVGENTNTKPGDDALSYHTEKESIGDKLTQDYRVFTDKKGTVVSREKIGVPYKNTEGVADVRVQAFGVVPQANTGTYFNRLTKKWMMNTDNGPLELSSEQVRNLGLTTKEETPTARTKTMEQLAPKVLERAYVVRNQIADEITKLGPLDSRARQLWSKNIGGPDPKFTAIRTNADLLATLLANMHVGASGAEKTIERFSQMLEVKNQSPENLLANVDEIIRYAEEARRPSIKPNNPMQPPSTKTSVIKYDAKGNRI